MVNVVSTAEGTHAPTEPQPDRVVGGITSSEGLPCDAGNDNSVGRGLNHIVRLQLDPLASGRRVVKPQQSSQQDLGGPVPVSVGAPVPAIPAECGQQQGQPAVILAATAATLQGTGQAPTVHSEECEEMDSQSSVMAAAMDRIAMAAMTQTMPNNVESTPSQQPVGDNPLDVPAEGGGSPVVGGLPEVTPKL